jgi:hypothetical protein
LMNCAWNLSSACCSAARWPASTWPLLIRVAGGSAEQDRPDEGQRQDETKSRYDCLLGPFGPGSGLGPAQPTCRPPLSGRTDHHTQHTLPKNADS